MAPVGGTMCAAPPARNRQLQRIGSETKLRNGAIDFSNKGPRTSSAAVCRPRRMASSSQKRSSLPLRSSRRARTGDSSGCGSAIASRRVDGDHKHRCGAVDSKVARDSRQRDVGDAAITHDQHGPERDPGDGGKARSSGIAHQATATRLVRHAPSCVRTGWRRTGSGTEPGENKDLARPIALTTKFWS